MTVVMHGGDILQFHLLFHIVFFLTESSFHNMLIYSDCDG